MKRALLVCLLLACSKRDEPARTPPRPAPASDAATSYAVGDKVVLYPVAVMTVASVGPRSATDATIVYGLRFVGEGEDSVRLDATQARHKGLRPISTPAQIDAFLHTLQEATHAARKPGATPPEPLEAVNGNDLQRLARVFPYLRAEDSIQGQMRRTFETLFVEEIAAAKGIDNTAAKAMLAQFTR